MLVNDKPASLGRAAEVVRQIAAIVFDIDGVLIDSWGFMTRLFKAACAAAGATADLESFRRLLGLPLPIIAARLGLNEAFVQAYEHMASDQSAELLLFPGVMMTLNGLQARGYRLAINTGKCRLRSMDLLARLGVLPCFEVLITGDDVVHPKPHPESLQRIAAQLDLPPWQMAFVGDMPVDIECARAAGVLSMGATWGIGTEAELAQAAPEMGVHSISRLLEIFAGPLGALNHAILADGVSP